MKTKQKFNTTEYVMELQYRYYSCLEELHLNRNEISDNQKEKDELLEANMKYYQRELDKKEAVINSNKKIMDSHKKSKARAAKANRDLKEEVDDTRQTLQAVIDDRNKIIKELQDALKLYTPDEYNGGKLKCKPVIALNVEEFKRLQDKLRNDNEIKYDE